MTPYAPALPPRRDFALILGDGTAKDVPGFAARKVKDCTLLEPIGHARSPSNPVHFSGVAFRGGDLVTAETADRHSWSPESHDGNYTVIADDGEGLTISCDAFGIGVIFIFRQAEHPRTTIISNNLHMLATICRHAGLKLHANRAAFLKRLFIFSIGQQPSGFTSFFDEIEFLAVDQYIRVQGGAATICGMRREEPAEYRAALDAGVAAMVRQVKAAAAFGRHLACRISGGYDSRLVFGALLKAELLDRTWLWTFPDHEDDFRSVKIFAGYYGAEFANAFPFLRNTVRLGASEALNARLSRNFGLYTAHLSLESCHRTGFDRRTFIIFNGGGGECYRNFYFEEEEVEARGALDDRIRQLVKSRLAVLGTASGLIADCFANEFRAMPGETARDKLRAHYMHFRNRFHFGSPTASDSNRLGLTPFMQRPFLDAAERLRRRKGDLRQLNYDALSALDERLPFFPFDEARKAFDDSFPVTPEAAAQKRKVTAAIQGYEGGYDPLSITSTAPGQQLDRGEVRRLLEANLKRAIEITADSKVYHGIDFDAYTKHIFDIRGRNQKAYQRYRDSIISTGALLEYCA